jgi:hypothetical protein
MIFADELQVEYLKEPLGISPTNIMLRWIVAGAKKQDGYQVKAVGSKGTVFDSGLVSSTKMQCLNRRLFAQRASYSANSFASR